METDNYLIDEDPTIWIKSDLEEWTCDECFEDKSKYETSFELNGKTLCEHCNEYEL